MKRFLALTAFGAMGPSYNGMARSYKAMGPSFKGVALFYRSVAGHRGADPP